MFTLRIVKLKSRKMCSLLFFFTLKIDLHFQLKKNMYNPKLVLLLTRTTNIDVLYGLPVCFFLYCPEKKKPIYIVTVNVHV